MEVGIVGGYAFLNANDDGAREPDPAIEPAAADVNVRLGEGRRASGR